MNGEMLKKIDKLVIILVAVALIVGGVWFLVSDKTKPENNDSVSVWDAETASSKKYNSYDEYKKEIEEKKNRDLAEYNKAIKGTIVERVQNVAIPSYDDEKQFEQLQSGGIRVMGEKSKDFPEGNFLWLAALEKNKNSFVVGDFNGDGLDDVAHIIGYSGGGSGYFYHLMIFTNKQGKLKYLTDEYIGDRIVVKSMRYEAGLFVIDMITQGKGDNFMGYCCPNTPATIKFKLENGQLIKK